MALVTVQFPFCTQNCKEVGHFVSHATVEASACLKTSTETQ